MDQNDRKKMPNNYGILGQKKEDKKPSFSFDQQKVIDSTNEALKEDSDIFKKIKNLFGVTKK